MPWNVKQPDLKNNPLYLEPRVNDLTSQLAEKATKTEFNNWVNTLTDGSPKYFFETLTALQTTYPSGASGVALVRETNPAKVYVWNGTGWQDFGDYQSAVDNNIYLKKSDIYGNSVPLDTYISMVVDRTVDTLITYSIDVLSPIVTENELISTIFKYVELTATIDKYITTVENNEVVENQTYIVISQDNIEKKAIEWGALGDSITAVDTITPIKGYLYKIQRDYGVNIYNYAIAGSGITDRGASTNTSYPPIYEQMTLMKGDHPNLDIITILAGVNDWQWGGIQIGTINDTGMTTYMGAYNYILSYLIDNYPDTLIVLITPLQRARFSQVLDSGSYTQAQKDYYINNKLDKWADAVLELGSKYGVPVYDAFRNSGLYIGDGVTNGSQYMITNFTGAENGSNPDGLHPNGRGHEKWYKRLGGFIFQNLGK